MSGYRTIVADPPWQAAHQDSPGAGGADWITKGRPQGRYGTMTVAEIGELEIPAADHSHLWLWALSQHLDWGFEVARSWGFEPVTTLTWCKPGLGVGRFQCNTEHVILARRGHRSHSPFGKTGGTWFDWPRGAHSSKPDAFYDLVEQVSPGPYLELFARRARFGWDYWGDESLGTAQIGQSAAQ